MKTKKSKPSRELEEAVYSFAKSLDTSAEVIFDHHVPDRDTGTLRQCDVWINAKFGNHWPISILVSCKYHGRKLNISDIDTFCNEVRSTSASTGVIYSAAGFTKSALMKARTNALACCRLYRNEPADIPQSIWPEFFLCKSSITLRWLTDTSIPGLQVWNDVFDIRDKSDSSTTILDIISDVFVQGQEQSHLAKKDASFPEDWTRKLQFSLVGSEELRIQIVLHWRKFHGRMEAKLVNGSYCFLDDSFKGHVTLPFIAGDQPGEGWEEIPAESLSLPAKRVLAVETTNDVRQTLRDTLGLTSLIST
ncbi:MAG: hypothetical protein HY870_01450 [Chloroflexi bacterium]|nr:hypothetical protein [Chloroflexota bacterium]